ncbi:TIGR03752 family integrating conjugative element protein [Legionella santicrucis]|nr:TIGR03752 family integrating conjugative element protein [Legionella santicrucis]
MLFSQPASPVRNMSSLESQNKQLQKDNETLKQAKPQSTNTVDWSKAIDSLKEEISFLKNKPTTDEPYPIEAQHTSNIKDIDSLLIKRENDTLEKTYWERLNAKSKPKSSNKISKPEVKTIRYYTIPAGSDLGRATLLSALIGEVPVEGKLMQPLFPFSAMINRGDLMAANGVPLPPDIAGMKVTGYAIGVGSFLDNISCVRAYVTAALFVFKDGHFVTVGKEQMNGTTEMINNDSLGYLTSPYGNPCIKGQYFTNAPRVLTAMMATGGIQGAGTALSQWQTSTIANANGSTTIPTGSIGRYALGGALSEGSVKVSDWLEKRIQGSFDMVFVPASYQNQFHRYQATQVSLHLTQTINLDKASNGRVLDYGRTQQTVHDYSLK